MSQHHIEEKKPETLTPSQPIDGSLLPEQASKETGGPEPRKQSAWQRWKSRLRLSLALLLPVMFETLDYTSTSLSSLLNEVVAASQPNIASVFGRLDLQSYIGTSYVLGSTVFLPVAASFADAFERYGAMQASVFIFVVGPALSTGAVNMPMVLLGRGISGVGAAGLLAVRCVSLHATDLTMSRLFASSCPTPNRLTITMPKMPSWSSFIHWASP